MPLTDVQISSDACQRLGGSSITAFTDGTREAALCSAIYPRIKEHLLSIHNWHFASKRAQLSREAVTPPNRWTYQYVLPSDRLGNAPIEVYQASTPRTRFFKEWEIVGDRLMSNVDELHVSYAYNAPESVFPPYFTELLTQAIMVELMIPLRGSFTEREGLRATVWGPGGEFDKAKFADSRNHPPRRYDDFSLIDAHGGETRHII